MSHAIYQEVSSDQVMTAPIMGEIAVSDVSRVGATTALIPNYNPDELVTRKGLQIYKKMRVDEQIHMALQYKKDAVLAPGWMIESAEDDAEEDEVKDFVEASLKHIDGSFDDTLRMILNGLDFGYSIIEKVWLDPSATRPAELQGKTIYKTFKDKDPLKIDMATDEFMNLLPDGILNTETGLTPMPLDKFIVYTYRKEYGNPYGISDMRPAYRAWWSKDVIIKFMNIFMERLANRPILAEGTPSDKDAILDALKKLQASSTIVVPPGVLKQIQILEPSKTAKEIFTPVIEYYDKMISRALLVTDRLMAAGETGAYSQAEVHFKVFVWHLKSLRTQIEEVVNEQVIRPLVLFNFGPVSMPTFKFKALTFEEAIGIAASWGDLVQKGAVTSDLLTENKIREIFGFPEKEEEEIEPTAIPPVDEVPPGVIPQDGSVENPVEEDPAKVAKPGAPNQFAEKPPRAKTFAEKRVNFKDISAEFEDIEDKTLASLRETYLKQRDNINQVLRKKLLDGTLTSAYVATGIELKFVNETIKTLRGMFDDSYNQGKRSGETEVNPQKNLAAAQQGIAVIPERALTFFNSQSRFEGNGIRNRTTQRIQDMLVRGVREGLTVDELSARIIDIYRPLTESGDIVVDGKQLQSYQINAIVRTNLNDAYNTGRLALGADLKGRVQGFQYSEILDDRTVQISQQIDGKAIRADSPFLPKLSYPLHFQDRGVFVYIFIDDPPVDYMSDAEIQKFIGMKKL